MAATEQAEATAAKATADARLAEANADKAEAEARSAQVTAQKDARAARLYDPTAAAAEQRATSLKNQAEADQAASDARRKQLSALIPDFSKVTPSTLTVGDGPAIGATGLTYAALSNAAGRLVGTLSSRVEVSGRVLITADLDLATTDAVYLNVTTGLQQLKDAMERLLPGEDGSKAIPGPLGAATDIAAALASAIPGVLSLLSAHRSLNSSVTTADDIAAAAAVAGALKVPANSCQITHDSFRTVPDGQVNSKFKEAGIQRLRLTSHRLDQVRLVATLTEATSKATSTLTDAEKALETATKAKTSTTAAEKAVQEATAALAEAKATQQQAQEVLATIDATAAAADEFLALIGTPVAAGRSMLATAALREQLHGGEPPFTHVLLVKGQAGQVEQSTTNMPLWFKDRFTTKATAAITYMLLKVDVNSIVLAGTSAGVASAHGKIGENYELQQ